MGAALPSATTATRRGRCRGPRRGQHTHTEIVFGRPLWLSCCWSSRLSRSTRPSHCQCWLLCFFSRQGTRRILWRVEFISRLTCYPSPIFRKATDKTFRNCRSCRFCSPRLHARGQEVRLRGQEQLEQRPQESVFCLESSEANRARRTHCETLHAELASYHHHRARRLRTDVVIYGWILEASSERAFSSQGVRRCSASQPGLCTSAAYASKQQGTVAHPRSCRRCYQSGEAGVADRDEASRVLGRGSFRRALEHPLQKSETVVRQACRQN